MERVGLHDNRCSIIVNPQGVRSGVRGLDLCSWERQLSLPRNYDSVLRDCDQHYTAKNLLSVVASEPLEIFSTVAKMDYLSPTVHIRCRGSTVSTLGRPAT